MVHAGSIKSTQINKAGQKVLNTYLDRSGGHNFMKNWKAKKTWTWSKFDQKGVTQIKRLNLVYMWNFEF